jgi:tRNA (mo5U34)-methyltransferase
MDDATLDRMKRIEWYHRIDLGGGVVTPGPNLTGYKLKTLHFPESFAGKSVLDVGAWDGFFSFEAERRGAARVVAVDSFTWNRGRKEGFEFAREVLHSKVEDKTVEVLDVSPESVGVHDVVLFLGVLYHMQHPLLALERIASVTRELLILETVVDLTFLRRPAMAYYPGESLHQDRTNYWGPNVPLVRALLLELGFTRVELVSKMSFPVRLGKAVYDIRRGLVKPSGCLEEVFGRSRAAFHAWK